MAHCCNIKPRSNGKAADCRVLGRLFESWSVDCRRRRRRHIRPTRGRTADQKICARGITIRPPLAPRTVVLPTAWGRVCHLQKTKTVRVCLTDCWPG